MAACAPVSPCACHPWSLRPGEQLPLVIDWSVFLSSVPGYALHSVVSASLTNLNTNPPGPADPDDIDTVPTIETAMPWTGDNPPVRIYGEGLTEAIIKLDSSVPLNNVFRFDITVQLKGCDGRVLQVSDCVFIQASML